MNRMTTALCLAILLYMAPSFSSSVPEIRKITPPDLSQAHLGKRIICHRPMRHGSPNMSVEQRGSQVISQNYGHGGSGWTLGPGSAAYVNQLLIHSPFATDLNKHTPIVIIGGGVLGLFSAYDLIQRGFSHITVVAEKFNDLASHNAGGLLAPVSMDNAPDMQKIIDQIGIDAYRFYSNIARKNNPHFQNGATIVPAYFQNRAESDLEPYVGKVMSPAKDVILDFGNGTKRPMVVYDEGIFINTAIIMTDLHQYLTDQKVKFVQRKIQSFDEIKEKYIINCSGLGAAELNHDPKMESVQGHLIMLKDQKPKDLQYMVLVYFNEGKTKVGQKVKRSFYMFPKHFTDSPPNDIGVIGGTFVEGATIDTPNEEEFDLLIEGARKFYGV